MYFISYFEKVQEICFFLNSDSCVNTSSKSSEDFSEL